MNAMLSGAWGYTGQNKSFYHGLGAGGHLEAASVSSGLEMEDFGLHLVPGITAAGNAEP